MELGQRYIQGQKQEQVISPVQMENLAILAMNCQELGAFLTNEQMENPMLEFEEPFGLETENLILGEWVTYRDRLEKDDRAVRNEEGYFREIPARESVSLYSHLRQQIPGEADGALRELAEKLIGLLDEKTGYFPVPKEKIIEAAGAEAETAIRWIRDMDPAGVGAFGLKDCLKIQLERKGLLDSVLGRIIDDYLEEVGDNQFGRISRGLKISTEKTKAYVRRIRELNPKPAKMFGSEMPVFVVPDLKAHKKGQWEIVLCRGRSREIHLNQHYMEIAAQAEDENLIRYFDEKIKRARQVIRAVEQREDTLIRLLSFALRYQEGFALGQGSKVPLSMRTAAQALGVHPSTVSRAAKDKYVELPCGVVPFKDLFPNEAAIKETTQTKQSAEDMLIQEIQEIISREDPQKPYSDLSISEKLQEKGIRAARRTVAKYRELAGIPGTAGRKKKP